MLRPLADDDPALIEAAVAAHVGWMGDVAAATGGEEWNNGAVRAVHQPQPRGELIFPFPADLDLAALDRALEWAEEAGVAGVGCWTSGLEDDAVLDGLLVGRGFSRGWEPHWMALDLDPASAPAGDERVTPASQVPEYDAYGEALLTMTRAQPQRSWHFVAREAAALAGFGWLHVPDTAPTVGGIFDVVVFDGHRRRGLGSAITAAACEQAARRGCRHVVLNATGEGELLYRSLGFRSLGHGRTWWLHLRGC